MSDIERAQEWLGCTEALFRPWGQGRLAQEGKPTCGTHHAHQGIWPCSEAIRLAALLSETRAEGWDEGFNAAADAVPEDVSRIVNPHRSTT